MQNWGTCTHNTTIVSGRTGRRQCRRSGRIRDQGGDGAVTREGMRLRRPLQRQAAFVLGLCAWSAMLSQRDRCAGRPTRVTECAIHDTKQEVVNKPRPVQAQHTTEALYGFDKGPQGRKAYWKARPPPRPEDRKRGKTRRTWMVYRPVSFVLTITRSSLKNSASHCAPANFQTFGFERHRDKTLGGRDGQLRQFCVKGRVLLYACSCLAFTHSVAILLKREITGHETCKNSPHLPPGRCVFSGRQ